MEKSKGAQVEGTSSPQLELLRDVGGAFWPSILSCECLSLSAASVSIIPLGRLWVWTRHSVSFQLQDYGFSSFGALATWHQMVKARPGQAK